MIIKELRKQLGIEIDNRNLYNCVMICRLLGLSLRHICEEAGVNHGNANRYILGYSIAFTDTQKNKLYEAMSQYV